MNKKALIVGISNYGNMIAGLDSPNTEIQEWRNLLVDTYKFLPENVRLLANERARKEEMVARLHWLFDDGQAEDKLVFVYCGHGIRLPERNGETGEFLDHMDEALLAYPQPGDDLAKAAFYDDDLFELYESADLPPYTDTTFILDCCFAGGVNLRDVPHRPAAMSVTPPIDLEHRSLGRRPPEQREWDARAVPVLVSAAGELNLAVEIDIGGARRSLFGYHTIKALREKPDLTYLALLEKIRPEMRNFFAQYPNVRGNRARLNNSFLN